MKNLSYVKLQIKELFERGAAHLFVGNFIVKFISLFGSIFIVRLLTKEEYGILGYIENLYSYGYIFVGLGLSIAILRYGIVIKDESERIGLYKFVYKTQTYINFALIAIIALVSIIYPHPSQYTGASILLIFLCIGLPFQDLTSTSLTIERTKMENKRYMYFSVMAAAISVILRIVGAYFGGIKGTVILKVIAEVLTCVVIIYYIYNKYIKGMDVKNISNQLKKEIMVYSVNNMVANGIWTLFMITEFYLISRILNDPVALADYKVACVFPSNMAIITSSIAVFVTPYFVEHEDDLTWIRHNYFKVLKATNILLGFFAIILFVFAPQIIVFLYGEKYLNIVSIMRILIIAHFINAGIKTLHISLLAAMGHAKENMLISIVGFILQVFLISIILPKYGILGLAINNVFVYFAMAVIIVVVFFKKYKILSKK